MLYRENNVLLCHDVMKISVLIMTELLFTYVLNTSTGLEECINMKLSQKLRTDPYN